MNLNGKRILVTGGAGAIGSNLVRRLLETPEAEVTVIDDLSSGHNGLEGMRGVNFIHSSILNDDVLNNVFAEKPDVVFHLAALFANQKSVEQPIMDLRVNGEGTLRLLQHSLKAGVRRFVFTSSSCVYGNKDTPIPEDEVKFGLDTPYAITKLLGEKYCEYFWRHHKLPAVTLRLFNSYGPGERPGKYRNVVPNFFQLALQGKPLVVYGTGNETRDFTYVEDTVSGIIQAATSYQAPGEIINLGRGRETRTIDLAEKINRLCGNEGNIQQASLRDWDTVLRRQADIFKAQRILGYSAPTELDEGLRKTYEWFKTLR